MNTKFFFAVSALAAGSGGGVHAQGESPAAIVEVVEVPVAGPMANGGPARAIQQKGFTDQLELMEKAAAGLGKLSSQQSDALDAQVAKEVKLARQGNVRGFAGTFISRRSEEERAAAGLGYLTTSEKYQLDRLVSRVLAVTPPQPPLAITRPPGEGDVLRTPFKWETHGFVELEYGFGSGNREYKAGTVGVTHVNPKTGTALSFVYSVAEGDGLWWGRDCGFYGRRRLWGSEGF